MKRLIPGLTLAAGWLLLLLEGNFLLFWALIVVIGLVGGREFIRMTLPDILYETDRIVLSIIITTPIFTSVYAQSNPLCLSFGVFLAFCALICFTIYHYPRFPNPLLIMKRGMMGIIFVGFLAAHLVLLHTLSDGAHWLIILTAVTAGSDSGAYWVGSRWGRRKLCPQISPKKTVEGAVGGIGAGIVAALVLYSFLDVRSSVLLITVLALLLSIVGMVGDLVESMIKRGTQTKDSGRILAGHGGVLDRVDSLLLAAPSLYYLLFFLGY